MSSTIDKLINSSISIAFLTLTTFSTAYCYCWGQALFHGIPWWHVEIGNGIIARSLAWVFGSSLILLFSYLAGSYLLKKISKNRHLHHVGCLRILILVSVFSIPVMLTFYLFIGKIPFYLLVIYAVLLPLCMTLFHKKWNHTDLQPDFRKLFSGERIVFFILFVFVYFSLLSLSIGYWRSELRQTYDYIEIEGKNYYILATNDEQSYIMGEFTRDNTEFLFFNRKNKDYYTVHVVKMEH